jgi:hypothetical protein
MKPANYKIDLYKGGGWGLVLKFPDADGVNQSTAGWQANLTMKASYGAGGTLLELNSEGGSSSGCSCDVGTTSITLSIAESVIAALNWTSGVQDFIVTVPGYEAVVLWSSTVEVHPGV